MNQAAETIGHCISLDDIHSGEAVRKNSCQTFSETTKGERFIAINVGRTHEPMLLSWHQLCMMHLREKRKLWLLCWIWKTSTTDDYSIFLRTLKNMAIQGWKRVVNSLLAPALSRGLARPNCRGALPYE